MTSHRNHPPPPPPSGSAPGLITEVHLANDGIVRRVKVRYINSSGTPIIVERPVQNLVVLIAAKECDY